MQTKHPFPPSIPSSSPLFDGPVVSPVLHWVGPPVIVVLTSGQESPSPSTLSPCKRAKILDPLHINFRLFFRTSSSLQDRSLRESLFSWYTKPPPAPSLTQLFVFYI